MNDDSSDGDRRPRVAQCAIEYMDSKSVHLKQKRDGSTDHGARCVSITEIREPPRRIWDLFQFENVQASRVLLLLCMLKRAFLARGVPMGTSGHPHAHPRALASFFAQGCSELELRVRPRDYGGRECMGLRNDFVPDAISRCDGALRSRSDGDVRGWRVCGRCVAIGRTRW